MMCPLRLQGPLACHWRTFVDLWKQLCYGKCSSNGNNCAP